MRTKERLEWNKILKKNYFCVKILQQKLKGKDESQVKRWNQAVRPKPDQIRVPWRNKGVNQGIDPGRRNFCYAIVRVHNIHT